MNRKNSSALILSFFLLVSCNVKEVDFVPGIIYRVTTTEGEGFVIFEHVTSHRWNGIYYLNEGRLMAIARMVELKARRGFALVDFAGKTIPILSYNIYKEPLFVDYPETWTYCDSVYAVTVSKDVVYGRAEGYWVSYPDTGGTFFEIFNVKRQELEQGKTEQDLTMDVYLPDDAQTTSRPLLVLIHGGAFFNGDKSDLGFPEWARYFAGTGYVVASVNYRLGFRANPVSVERAGFRGVQDVDAAIRYLIHNKDEFFIDPNRVFVAGTSAGGITALNVAFMRNHNIPLAARGEGGIKAINVEFQEPYSIQAVGNMWGAVNDLSILDNNSASVISFHSTGDQTVPFGRGHPFEVFFFNKVIFPTMYGSGQIYEYVGRQRSALYSYDLPNRHTLHIDVNEKGEKVLNSRYIEIETAMRNFFSAAMLSSSITVEHSANSQTFSVSSPNLESVYWNVEGGVILRHADCSIDILLFPDAQTHTVTVCGKYKSGLTFKHRWSI